jgi:hypothetical protein
MHKIFKFMLGLFVKYTMSWPESGLNHSVSERFTPEKLLLKI